MTTGDVSFERVSFFTLSPMLFQSKFRENEKGKGMEGKVCKLETILRYSIIHLVYLGVK